MASMFTMEDYGKYIFGDLPVQHSCIHITASQSSALLFHAAPRRTVSALALKGSLKARSCSPSMYAGTIATATRHSKALLPSPLTDQPEKDYFKIKLKFSVCKT